MNEYRCVIPSLYPARTEFSSMQGHYIHAPDCKTAHETFAAAHPGERVEVRLWNDDGGPASADLVAPLTPEGVFTSRIEAILAGYRSGDVADGDAISLIESALVKLKKRGSA